MRPPGDQRHRHDGGNARPGQCSGFPDGLEPPLSRPRAAHRFSAKELSPVPAAHPRGRRGKRHGGRSLASPCRTRAAGAMTDHGRNRLVPPLPGTRGRRRCGRRPAGPSGEADSGNGKRHGVPGHRPARPVIRSFFHLFVIDRWGRLPYDFPGRKQGCPLRLSFGPHCRTGRHETGKRDVPRMSSIHLHPRDGPAPPAGSRSATAPPNRHSSGRIQP
jgi:hypothetical protein